MNNQMPNQFMPSWPGNPNPNWGGGIFPPQPQPGCNCREQIAQLDNRINRMERQIRRLENRVSRLENGFPVPLSTAGNNDDYNTYQPNNSGMYMM